MAGKRVFGDVDVGVYTYNPRPLKGARTGFHPGLPPMASHRRTKVVGYATRGPARVIHGSFRRGGRGVLSRAPARGAQWSNAGELGGMDTVLTQALVIATTSTNASSTALNLVEPGNGSYNRRGRKIHLKSIRMKGVLRYSSQTAATTFDVVRSSLRCVVVWDKQPSGVLPKWDDIIGHTTQDGQEASTLLGSLRYDNTGRFSILHDSFFAPPLVMPSDGAAAGNVTSDVPFDIFLKLAKVTIFSGDSDPVTIADISSGGLYVYWRAFNASTATENDWQVLSSSTSRLRFTS